MSGKKRSRTDAEDSAATTTTLGQSSDTSTAATLTMSKSSRYHKKKKRHSASRTSKSTTGRASTNQDDRSLSRSGSVSNSRSSKKHSSASASSATAAANQVAGVSTGSSVYRDLAGDVSHSSVSSSQSATSSASGRRRSSSQGADTSLSGVNEDTAADHFTVDQIASTEFLGVNMFGEAKVQQRQLTRREWLDSVLDPEVDLYLIQFHKGYKLKQLQGSVLTKTSPVPTTGEGPPVVAQFQDKDGVVACLTEATEHSRMTNFFPDVPDEQSSDEMGPIRLGKPFKQCLKLRPGDSGRTRDPAAAAAAAAAAAVASTTVAGPANVSTFIQRHVPAEKLQKHAISLVGDASPPADYLAGHAARHQQRKARLAARYAVVKRQQQERELQLQEQHRQQKALHQFKEQAVDPFAGRPVAPDGGLAAPLPSANPVSASKTTASGLQQKAEYASRRDKQQQQRRQKPREKKRLQKLGSQKSEPSGRRGDGPVNMSAKKKQKVTMSTSRRSSGKHGGEPAAKKPEAPVFPSETTAPAAEQQLDKKTGSQSPGVYNKTFEQEMMEADDSD